MYSEIVFVVAPGGSIVREPATEWCETETCVFGIDADFQTQRTFYEVSIERKLRAVHNIKEKWKFITIEYWRTGMKVEKHLEDGANALSYVSLLVKVTFCFFLNELAFIDCSFPNLFDIKAYTIT